MPFKTRNVILFCWTQKFVLFSLSEIQFVIVGGGARLGQALTRSRVINSTNSQWGTIIWVTQCTADTTAREGESRGYSLPNILRLLPKCVPTISLVIGVRCDD